MSFKQANEGKVNPNYSSNKEGYKDNCAICVATFEARLRGYDIEALPFTFNNPYILQLAYDPRMIYIDNKINRTPYYIDGEVTRANDCEDWLKDTIKYGERYAFIFKPINSANSHIVEVFKTITGQLKFYDPQKGKSYNNEYLKDIEYRPEFFGFSPHIFRTDNLELNEEFLEKMYKYSTK